MQSIDRGKEWEKEEERTDRLAKLVGTSVPHDAGGGVGIIQWDTRQTAPTTSLDLFDIWLSWSSRKKITFSRHVTIFGTGSSSFSVLILF